MILNKTLLAHSKIASRDDLRPILQAIKIENGTHAVSTDGFKLLKTPLPQVEFSDLPNMPGYKNVDIKDALIPMKSLETAIKQIPKKSTLPILQNTWTVESAQEETIRLISTDLESVNVPEIRKIEGEFPNYQIIIDSVEEEPIKSKIAVNAQLMVEIMQAFVLAGVANNIVTMEIRSSDKAIIIRGENEGKEKVLGLIMPVRIDE